MYDNASATTWTSGATSGTAQVQMLSAESTTNFVATTSSPGQMQCTVGGTTFPPNPPPNPPTLIGFGGYWWNGWWYPYAYPQPYPVPYAVPAPDVSPRQKLAIEALKLGTKIPKKLRDQALKILSEGLT